MKIVLDSWHLHHSGLSIKDELRQFGTHSEKSEGVVWKNLPSGDPKGNQTFPRGAAPRKSLITQGTSCGQIFQKIPEDFSLLVRLWALKTEDYASQSCPMGLFVETVGSNLLKSDSVKSRPCH